ncbi:MAG TPA: hypothetical protein VJ965_00995 [Anaerolineales bacterium]|nr:hypothetical protein [Anaerolineales bacterium]
MGAVIGIIFEVGRKSTSTIQPTPTFTPAPVSTSTKANILFIGVNQINSQISYLESAWLANQEFYLEDDKTNIKVTLISLYPVTQSMITTPDLAVYTKPHQPMMLNPENFESLEGLPPLSQANLSWENVHIVLLDEYFMNSAIVLSNPTNPTQLKPPSDSLFVKPWTDPAGAYLQQHSILTNLCHHPEGYFRFNVAHTLIDLYQQHIRSTLTSDDLLSMWQINVNLGDIEIVCDIFPEP